MADPFIGSIRIFSFDFAPKGWAFCDGQSFPLQQNQALFSIIGILYGGDGKQTFALPDFRGCIPIHNGQGQVEFFKVGQRNAAPLILTEAELPLHTHEARCTTEHVNTGSPTEAIWATVDPADAMGVYAPPALAITPMAHDASGTAGDSAPHYNMMPTLGLNFCIALEGVYPPRN